MAEGVSRRPFTLEYFYGPDIGKRLQAEIDRKRSEGQVPEAAGVVAAAQTVEPIAANPILGEAQAAA